MPTITKRCDNCDRLIEADDDLGGQKVRCPACGDVNVMPGAKVRVSGGAEPATPARTSRADRATAAGYPPDSGPEQDVMLVRPAMFRARPLLFSGLVLATLGGIVGGFILLAIPVVAGLCFTGALAALIWLGVWKVMTMSTRLRITNKRTVAIRGLIARASTEVLHDSIRNVQVEQNVMERILGTGTIGISSSGQDGIEIHVRKIPRPDAVTRVIDLYRPLD